MQTLETNATATPVASHETTALVVPRFTIATGSELAEGKTSKKSYVESRVAAGIEKKQAVAEFESALSEKRTLLTGMGSAILTQFPVDRIKRTGSRVYITCVDLTAKRAAAAQATADRIAKLEAQIAKLKASA